MARNEKLIRTTERTGKRWKALQALAFLMLLVGSAWWMGAASVGVPTPTAVIVLWAVGLPMMLAAKVGGWWYHG